MESWCFWWFFLQSTGKQSSQVKHLSRMQAYSEWRSLSWQSKLLSFGETANVLSVDSNCVPDGLVDRFWQSHHHSLGSVPGQGINQGVSFSVMSSYFLCSCPMAAVVANIYCPTSQFSVVFLFNGSFFLQKIKSKNTNQPIGLHLFVTGRLIKLFCSSEDIDYIDIINNNPQSLAKWLPRIRKHWTALYAEKLVKVLLITFNISSSPWHLELKRKVESGKLDRLYYSF